jgi:glycosyltransferase involved in cell wall biosynthesis
VNGLQQSTSTGVSVIIPVYNQWESLKVSLKHFVEQTYPPDCYEIIVVDDGSTDGLMQRVYEADWPRAPCPIRYIRQENQGRAVARNTGAAMGKGELFVFCDADRVPEHDFISRHAGCNPNGVRLAVIGCSWDYFGKVDLLEKIPDTPWTDIRRFSRKSGYYSKMMKLFNRDGTTNSAVAWASFLVGNSSLRREDFERARGFDPDFKTWGFEHFELAIRLQSSGVSFYSCPQAANYHIPHPRETGFYQTMLESSLELLKSKHPDDKYGLLGDFLLGKIPLQDFEIGFGGTLTAGLNIEKPIFNYIK